LPDKKVAESTDNRLHHVPLALKAISERVQNNLKEAMALHVWNIWFCHEKALSYG
jgi:hypothetical protein